MRRRRESHHHIEGTGGVLANAVLVAGGGAASFVIAAGFLLRWCLTRPENRRQPPIFRLCRPGPRRGPYSIADAEQRADQSRLRPTPLGGIGQPPRAAPRPACRSKAPTAPIFID